MKQTITDFIAYIHDKKNTSINTEISYRRDLNKLASFLEDRAVRSFSEVTSEDLKSYLTKLKDENRASSTISRSIASIHALFQYLQREDIVKEDPSESLKPPKVEKKAPEFMSVQEVDKLLRQPDQGTPKGMRDSAMLELLYATGMRVSELVHLKTSDINLKYDYVVCHDNGKERVIPFGAASRNALLHYINGARNTFVKDRRETALFTNCYGRSMSRQGFWKVLKGYAVEAGIEHDITPHTLRHSFAVHMLQNGADVRSVQEMMGHSDISSTQVYLGVNTAKIRDVYMRAHPRH